MEIIASLEGWVKLNQQLRQLQMTQTEKRRYFRLLAREIMKQTRQRARNQQDLEGRPWAKRKRGKRKMMKKITRAQNMKAEIGDDGAEISWPKTLIGIIARKQQEGIGDIMTARKLAKRNTGPNCSGRASDNQAAALIAVGFRHRIKGGREIKVSRKWITENVNADQAGAILRAMREGQTKQTWQIPLAARSFLGASTEDLQSLSKMVMEEMLKSITKG